MENWNTADGSPSEFAASTPEYALDAGRDPMPPVYPGPVITAPPISGVPIPTVIPGGGVVPLPLQYPLRPPNYPAYYELPITYPYPLMRGVDEDGDEVEVRFFPLGPVPFGPAPFYPPPFYPPRPYFYPPRPFLYPLPPFPPFFI